MDLLNRIHSEEFQLGVMVTVVGGLILGGIIFLLGILFASFRKFLKSLPSKIKLLITNVGSWDFSQRILQNRKQGEHGQALDDYVQSFGGWGSEDTDGITLSFPECPTSPFPIPFPLVIPSKQNKHTTALTDTQ